MDSSQIGALGLVRLVAGCFVVFGILDGALYLTQYFIPMVQHHHTGGSLNILRLVYDSIPLIIGIVIFVKAKAIAEWLSDVIQ